MLGIEIALVSLLTAAALVGVAITSLVSYVLLNKNLPYKLLEKMQSVPKEHKDLAVRSFRQAEDNSKLIWLYDLSAPVVMLLVLPFVKKEAERLPTLFSKWDNEVSINGDGYAVLRDNRWVRVMGDELQGEIAVPYSSPDYTGDAYYCKRFHPRSFFARYVWLGLRNRASKASEDAGVVITATDREDSERWGTEPSKSKEGTLLIRAGKNYQIMSTKKIGVFCRRTNYGFKLNNSLAFNRARAMVVCIAVSLPLWKK